MNSRQRWRVSAHPNVPPTVTRQCQPKAVIENYAQYAGVKAGAGKRVISRARDEGDRAGDPALRTGKDAIPHRPPTYAGAYSVMPKLLA